MFENGTFNGNTTGNERRAASYLRLYFAIVQGTEGAVFYPPERQKEIDSVTDANLKAQKQTSWKLLEYAIPDTFNKRIEDFTFQKVNGKWTTGELFFSISHSKDLVCVGVSDAPVGVDIESLNNFLDKVKDPFKFLGKIGTDSEKKLYKSPSIGRLLRLWTGKESNFKRGNLSDFIPSKVEIDIADTKYACVVQEGGFTVSGFSGCEVDCDLELSQDGKRYMLAVCSQCKTDCKLYFVDLSNNAKVRL